MISLVRLTRLMRLVHLVRYALCAAAASALLAAATARAADAVAPEPDTQAVQQQVLVLLNLPPQHYRPDSNYAGSYSDAAGRAARRRIAAGLAREHGLSVSSDWPMPLLGVDCFVMAVPAELSAGLVAQELSRDARVAWAQTMNVFQAQGHDDPLFAVQPAAHEWQLAALHETATGRQVRVAVIDSAVERTHPDLARQIELNQDFVAERPAARSETHGTAVAGIIAAQADNGIGIVGVAPRSRLLALRACWQQAPDATVCSSLSLAQALNFAITHDAQVINLSLSGPPDRLLARLLDVALGQGIAVVAAADGRVADGGFPAAHRGVVAVAADAGPGSTPAGAVSAPGRDIPTTVTGARWALVSGSSYAAAHVAGLLALLREARERREVGAPRLTAADDLVLRPDGRIDACASLSRVARACSCDCSAAHSAPTVARQ